MRSRESGGGSLEAGGGRNMFNMIIKFFLFLCWENTGRKIKIQLQNIESN